MSVVQPEWRELALLRDPPVLAAWTVQLPFATPLSLNDRQGYWAKAKSTKTWLEGTTAALKEAGVPHCERVAVWLLYTPKYQRRRDVDNLVGGMKPAVDALVVAGVVDDDTQDYVSRHWPLILDPAKDAPDGRFVLVVERLE